MTEETPQEAFNPAGVLWNDNPASEDLLGINSVVATVATALSNPLLDPITIGLHSPWGGGKTSTLNILEAELKKESGYIVIRTNPWEYDDHSDVRGLLISEVVQSLEQTFKETAGIGEKAKDLLSRISWSRVTALAAKGLVTSQWKPQEIVDVLTPQPRTEPKSMNGFRDSFEDFLGMLHETKRVIILVDDLDRCLPEAVMATLEAIKLFLSVEKMAFVLAADQDMVRDAISASLDASGRQGRFVSSYLDKIVQLPISLPRLNPEQASSYIALLFAGANAPSPSDFQSLLAHCSQRRKDGKNPILSDLGSLDWKPQDDVLDFAQKIADGLALNIANNPRYIKRFLNALSVRTQIAKENGIEIDPDIIVKLFILEDRFSKSFDHLVSLPAPERKQLITDWRKWGQEEVDDKPDGVAEDTREWAATLPEPEDLDIDRYLALASSFKDVTLGAALSNNQIELAQNLTGQSETVRSAAMDNLKAKSFEEQAVILDAMFALVRSIDSIDNLIKSAVEICKHDDNHSTHVADGIKEHCWSKLTPLSAVELKLSEVPSLTALASEISTDESLSEMVRTAVQD